MINYKELNEVDAKRFFCFIEKIKDIKGNYPENSKFFIDHSNGEVVGFVRKTGDKLEEIFRYPEFLIDNSSHYDDVDKIELNYNDSPELLVVTDLKYSPMLKELLIMYVSRQYEENARYENYYLMAEYELLKGDNKLDLLFIEERLTNILNSDELDE
jgi:hypothetical protein